MSNKTRRHSVGSRPLREVCIHLFSLALGDIENNHLYYRIAKAQLDEALGGMSVEEALTGKREK